MPLNMTRYQRVSPDCLPPHNGRKLYMRTLKEDDPQTSKSHRIPTFPSDFNGKPLRPRPPEDRIFPPPRASPSPEPPTHLENHAPESSGGGRDVVLQWGQNKRSRGARAERSGSGDDSSNGRHSKIPRRVISAVNGRQGTAAMPPPGSSYGRGGGNLRALAREPSVVSNFRISEERQEKRPPSSAPDRMRKAGQTAAHPTANGSSHAHVDQRNPSSTHSSEHEAPAAGGAPATTVAEKLNMDLFEWPRIYLSLSRKEKEDDFLAMKGTKLPQRPKKRAKNIDKSLQYCFPGMWLSDLTKGRYEVREKKCVKKKRRGLKGMESMDSDSD